MIKVVSSTRLGGNTRKHVHQTGWVIYPFDNSYCQNSLGRNLKNNYRRNITLVISEDMPVGKRMMDLPLNIKEEIQNVLASNS